MRKRVLLIDLLLLAYSGWIIWLTIHAVLNLYADLLTPGIKTIFVFAPWYATVGTQIIFMLLIYSAFRCVWVISHGESWRYVLITGIVGESAYVLTLVLILFKSCALFPGTIEMVVPCSVIAIGLYGVFNKDMGKQCDPIWLPILQKIKSSRSCSHHVKNEEESNLGQALMVPDAESTIPNHIGNGLSDLKPANSIDHEQQND